MKFLLIALILVTATFARVDCGARWARHEAREARQWAHDARREAREYRLEAQRYAADARRDAREYRQELRRELRNDFHWNRGDSNGMRHIY
jgi:hypothetical protein